MLSVDLDPQTEERLDRLAKMSGRSKSQYAREAILEHIQDMEDAQLAVDRLNELAGTYSAEDVKRELDL